MVTSAEAQIKTQPHTAASIVKTRGPAVVRVEVTGENGEQSFGTGFFIRVATLKSYTYGTVITNYHVIEAARDIRVVTTSAGTFKSTRVLSSDKEKDVAILRVVSYEQPQASFRECRIGMSRSVSVGDKLFVIGNPQGLTNTVSEGLLSGIRRGDDGSNLFQLTAPISKGSSGSPVFDARGLVVAVVIGYLKEGQNLNFAIPLDEVAHLQVGDGTWTVGGEAYISELVEADLRTPRNRTQPRGKNDVLHDIATGRYRRSRTPRRKGGGTAR